MGNLQRLSIYGWISHHHPAGPDKPGDELGYCPSGTWYGPNAKSALVNARLKNRCDRCKHCSANGCCQYMQGDAMDTYEEGYAKLNKKTQKMKPGSELRDTV